jgi:hypothetical protein
MPSSSPTTKDSYRLLMPFVSSTTTVEPLYKEQIKHPLLNGKHHPKNISVDEIQPFLNHLISTKNVAISIRNKPSAHSSFSMELL